jgi:hypothetical protein
MKGKGFLAMAVLFAATAVLAQLWPPERTPPSVTINPAEGVYREPVEISFSSEPGATVYFSLGQGEAMPYSVPLKLKRDTVVRFHARDRFGNGSPESEARFEIRLDKDPPRTTASPRGGKFFHPVSVRLRTETDARIHYTTDGSEPSEDSSVYAGPVALRETATIRFFAVDKAGNREVPRKETYRITLDTAKPVTLAEPSGGLFNAPVKVSLSSRKGSTIYFTADGSRPSRKSPEFREPVEFIRSGVLRFFAVDEAGNQEEMREESYVIDRNPPSVRVDPPGGNFPGPVEVTLRADERGQIFFGTGAKKEEIPSTLYTKPFTLSESTEVTYFAVDLAGNRGAVGHVEFVVDTTGPETVLRPPGGRYSGRIRVKIETSEPADIYYTLDGTVPDENSTRYEGPISIEKNAVLSYLAVDMAGNKGSPGIGRYILDSTPPVTRARPPGGTFHGPVEVTLVTEEGAVTRYSVDGVPPSEASSQYAGPILLEKDTTLKFYSTDGSGNREEIRVEEYSFDSRPPEPGMEGETR